MSAASTLAILPHIPSELLEEILLKLPIKSLLRFSTVSKSWLSMISESRFVQEQKRRAAINGVERIVTVSQNGLLDRNTSVRQIPHTSSTGIDVSTHLNDLICPVEGTQPHLRASCDGLWLVEAANIADTKTSLHLWNPSTRTHRKQPDPMLLTTAWTTFVYGLGYDSAADDYKVLKIAREGLSFINTELYSLKSDSWKTISPPPPPGGGRGRDRCEYVNGSFHWIRTCSDTNTIVSFNLSTEKCGEIAFPAVALDSDYAAVEVVVARGKLCVTVNNAKSNPDSVCFVLWVMEDYGVENSWTKTLNIEYSLSSVFYNPYGDLRPVYFYDNGDVLFDSSFKGLCMYKNEGARLKRVVASDVSTVRGGFIYVESLVSPLPG